MKKIALAAMAATLLSVGAASAADMAVKARPAPPPVVAVYNWTGFYIGAHAGYTWSDPSFYFPTVGHFNTAAGQSFGFGVDGFMGGGHAGYNWQMNNIVLGIEGSISYTDLNGSAGSPFFVGQDVFSTKQEWIATVTPRLGFASGAWLFYVKGGVAFTELHTQILHIANDYNARSETKTGWTAGGGVEWMASPNWIVGVEGNYYDFGTCCGGNTQNLFVATNLPNGLFSNHETRFDNWSILGRVSYKWGGPVVAKY